MHSTLPHFLNPYGIRFHLIQLSLWGTYCVIFPILWYSYTPPPMIWVIAYMVTGLFSSTLLAFVAWSARGRPFKTQILFTLFCAIFAGILWRVNFHIISWHGLELFIPKNITLYSYIHQSLLANIHMYAWTGGYFLLTYYAKYTQQRERAQKAEILAKEAQIKLLHLQISPHFLFNVLNSLDTLLLKENIVDSRKMLGKLSLFLRETLNEDPAQAIPIKDELARTKCYLDIELVRFGDKLTVEWQCEKAIENTLVPSLILQPLVENAIKHSVGKNLHGGTIKVQTTGTEETIELAVVNLTNGDEIDKDQLPDGLGIGLDNIRSRLAMMYGDKAALEHGVGEDGAYTVKILIEKSATETGK